LLDISINKAEIPGDWKKATVVPIYTGWDRSVVTNYRPVAYSQRFANKWSTSLQGT
jgi:hypothetical protein